MTDLSVRIEAILKRRREIEEEISDLHDQNRELGKRLKRVQSQVKLICQDCGHTLMLKDAELIWEFYNGWYSQIDEESYYRERLLWVCPSCSYITYVRDTDDPEWGNPKKLSKATYKWHSDPGNHRPEDRVEVLLKPALERRAKERAEREKKEEIERARQVLRAHGEL